MEPSFPNGGMPTIRVTAHDFLQRLTHGKLDRAVRASHSGNRVIPVARPCGGGLVSGTNLLIPSLDPVGAALSHLMTLATLIAAPDGNPKKCRIRVSSRSESTSISLPASPRTTAGRCTSTTRKEPKGYVLRFQFLMQDYSPSVSLEWGKSLMDFTPRITTVGDVFGVSTRASGSPASRWSSSSWSPGTMTARRST